MRKHAKILFKEFGSSFGRFIAIAGIIALSLAFLIGLTISTPDIKASYAVYFEDNRLGDFTVMSGAGFLTDDDISEIDAVDDVEKTSAAFQWDAYCTSSDDRNKTVRFFGVGNEYFGSGDVVNKLTLAEGRFPAEDAAGEAVAVVPFGSMEDVAVGDTFTVAESDVSLPDSYLPDELADYADMFDFKVFEQTEFEIVGIVSSPLYFSVNDETCTKGDGKADYILFTNRTAFANNVLEALLPLFDTLPPSMLEGLPVDAQSLEKTQYTTAWVSAADSNDYEVFSTAYDDYADEVADKISATGEDLYVLDRSTNLSYYSMSINADKVADIAGIFPIFFIAVAALVAFSTIVRMVDEDRGQIGTLRSLGYSGARIAGKYIFYSVTACALGLVIGIPLGLTILPLVIYNAYGSMYTLPAMVFTADWLVISLCSVLSLAATALVAVLACRSTMKETPAAILQPRAPKPGKRILLERIKPLWAILPFKYKATMRNIFRFKRNLIMTVLAVAGCSALILAGFGMMNSTAAVTDLQFNQIYSFDLTVGVSSDYTASEDMTAFLDGKNYLEVRKERGAALGDGHTENINLVTAGSELSDFIDIGEFTGDSVKVSKGLADAFGLSVGDDITVENASGDRATLKITDIVTMYSECWVFVGQNEYEDKFGDASFNSLFVASNTADDDQSAVAERLYGMDCVSSVTFTSSEREVFDNLTETLTLVVLVLVICAGALVVIVLYNLTNINIGERKKEIATLKVLGYKKREVSGYVFREIAILVILGIAVGIGLGWAILAFILGSIQAPYLTFPLVIDWWSYLVTAAATLLFSGLVDLILLPKLNKIDMADSMKAVD